MNLLDMLSTSEAEEEPLYRVFHLPTLMCPVQKALTSIVLSIFSENLVQERRAKRSRTNINVLLDSSEDPSTSAVFEIMNLLFEQLRIIARHPTLLVDHFIPKKFLLMQTNERMINMSGNFQLLNRIVDTIVEKDEPFTLLVVSTDIKELELVEGLIIGKTLSYSNLCSSKLYVEESSGESKVTINLVTAHHLYNNFSIIQEKTGVVSYNAVFSLDQAIDLTAPSMQLLEQVNPRMPVLVPVALDSIEHLIMVNPPPSAFFAPTDVQNPHFQWRLGVVHDLIMTKNHNNRLDSFFLHTYGRHMHKLDSWLRTGKGTQWVAGLMKKNPANVRQYNQEDLASALAQMSCGVETTYKGYKNELTNRCLKSVEEIESYIAHVEKDVLPHMRQQENKRQLRHDEDEELIAQNYHKLRKLTEDAKSAENRLARVDADARRTQAKRQESEERDRFIREETDTDKLNAELVSLQKELDALTAEYNTIEENNTSLRQEYQQSSAEAVKLSAALDKVQASNAKLSSTIDGPGMRSLPSLIRRDAISDLETNLRVLRNNNDFMASFTKDKLDRVAKERHSVMEATQTGSNSRPSNRMSRAATPL